jgi:hypothetical protein
MDLPHIIFEGLVYDFVKFVFGPLLVTAGATFILRRIFRKLEGWKDILYFAGTVFVLLVFIFAIFVPKTEGPKLAGGIHNLISGGFNNGRDTIAVMTVTVMNAGSMQTIVKGWDVEVTLAGKQYQGSLLVPAPKEFKFTLPDSEPNAPTAITNHGEDSIVSLTPPCLSREPITKSAFRTFFLTNTLPQ